MLFSISCFYLALLYRTVHGWSVLAVSLLAYLLLLLLNKINKFVKFLLCRYCFGAGCKNCQQKQRFAYIQLQAVSAAKDDGRVHV